MKILSIGTDRKIFDENSEVRKRVIEYGKLAEELHIVILTQKSKVKTQNDKSKLSISNNAFIYLTNSRNKLFYIFDAIKIGKKIIENWKLKIENSSDKPLVTCQDPFETGFIGWRIARKFKLPLQLQVHTDFLSPYFWKESFLNKIRVLLGKFLIKRADSIRVVSERIKQSLLQATSYKLQTKVTVLPIFVDTEKIKNTPIKTDLHKKYPQFDFIILMASRFSKEKNIELAIGAFSEVVKIHPKVGLIIVGSGQEKQNYEPACRRGRSRIKKELQKNIIIENWTDDLASYYKTTDLFLLTSNYEGYGRTLVEAAAVGCKIISSDAGVAPEILEKENIFAVGDKNGLIQKLIAALSGSIKETKTIPTKTKEEYLKEYKEIWESAGKRKPKILIVTQKVDINDDVLGFFHDWLSKMAESADLVVVANSVGRYELPENVKIFSLGKERGAGKLAKFFKYQFLLLKFLPKSDGIFYHMCPEYVFSAGLWPKIFRKKTLLWYTHKAVNWKLKLAEKLIDGVFTASKESFRLPSKKVEITGHGIDLEKFSIFNFQFSKKDKKTNDKFRIISVGRIAPVKNYDLLIDAAEILKNKNFSAGNWEIKIAGSPALESDKIYFERLKEKIREKKLEDEIIFVGPIPNKDIVDFYQKGDLFVNFSDTGSLDKAVLEAMACGLKILTSNEAFARMIPEEDFTKNDAGSIANKIFNLSQKENNSDLQLFVVEKHNLANLIKNVVNFYRETI
ncbi:glycosyltransferase [Candidatus Parcubacteria bacterium]|nr:MAG: glycosyltransferase [Candidatus Parcubacteria bacterium]